ncbi:MAG: VIT domain-containing protein [Armatimonadota bacterium]
MGASRRRFFAGAAVLLTLVSVAVEVTTRICASYFFDPLPNALAIGTYLFLAGIILLNERQIRRAEQTLHTLHQAPSPGQMRAAFTTVGLGLGIAIAFTLLFLPLLPIAIFPMSWFGGGFCGLSPLLNLLVLLAQLGKLESLQAAGGALPRTQAWTALTLAILAGVVLCVGRPVAVGYFLEKALVSRSERAKAMPWLRRLDAADEVLRLCYGVNSSGWVWLGRTFGTAPDRDEHDPRRNARRLYYLLTGSSFRNVEPPSAALQFTRWDDSTWAVEGGDEAVGRAIDGLSLASSRIDGVLDPETETAQYEWTATFRNESSIPEEARASLLLPEGAVVDKASLWIDGEERPAAFGRRDLVQQAYEAIAVREQRDPLLVTARDSGEVMIRCFPVPERGEMKIRLGFSAPLRWHDSQAPRLRLHLPALQQVNFRIPASLAQDVWLEGAWPEGRGRLSAGGGWELSSGTRRDRPSAAPRHSARVRLSGAAILAPPPLDLLDAPRPRPGDRLSAELVRRSDPFAPAKSPLDLLVLVENTRAVSAGLGEDDLRRLDAALDRLPAGSRVALATVDELARPKPAALRWRAPEERPAGWWRAIEFVGGIDPVPALEKAWKIAAARRSPSAILWIHSAIPAELAEASVLSVNLERRRDGPALVGLQVGQGEDALMRELGGSHRIFALARRAPETLAEAVELAAVAATAPLVEGAVPLGGREPAINGTYVAAETAGKTTASRLAAYSRVLAPWYRGAREGKEIEAAQKLAIARRLVTPMSGAVVLENREQYERFALDPNAGADSIPSVPEPGMLALLAAAGGMAAAARVRARRRKKEADECLS